MCNKCHIFLHDFIIPVSIGIHDFEQEKPQRLKISVELEVRYEPRLSDRDDITLTVDYDFIRKTILELTKTGHLNTQEYLVHRLCKDFAQHPGVSSGWVSSEKLDVYPEDCSVGYRLSF